MTTDPSPPAKSRPAAGRVAPQIIQSTHNVGLMVRQQRRSQSVRIDDAAALVGVSVDLFSRLENGKGAVRLDKLLTVLDGMGLRMVVAPKGDPLLQQVQQVHFHSSVPVPDSHGESAGN